MCMLLRMGLSKILVLIVLLASTYALPTYVEHGEEWNLWKEKYGKTYVNEKEEFHRYTVWLYKRMIVTEHNLHADTHGYTLEMNEFSDLRDAELATSLKGSLALEGIMELNATGLFKPDPNFNALSELDWRKKGAVTPVKNQKTCGACWAFSATGAIEGQHFRKTNKLVSLSEQNLIDCSTRYGNKGCNGGNAYKAFKYVKDNKGIDTESSYPYLVRNGVCSFASDRVGATVKGFNWVTPKGNEYSLLQAVTRVGPISVMIDANHTSFFQYKEGVYYNPLCSSVKHDHEILVVGYGSLNGYQDYWLIKNSWGTNWGIGGYAMMARNRNNHCGIANYPSYPLV